MEKILAGYKVINLAYNLPGPFAAYQLKKLGANVTKIEPPGGDPLGQLCREWYEEMSSGQHILQLDLKSSSDWKRLSAILAEGDILITSLRPSASERLGLGWDKLKFEYPNLCLVEIIGYPPPDEEKPGHDLTYQAELGLVSPPGLPPSLYADLFGGQKAAQAALSLLINRVTSGSNGRMRVYLAEVSAELSLPVNYRLTGPGDVLGGGLARYNVYKTRDGWIAIAVLEDKFWHNLISELGLTEEQSTKGNFDEIFIRKDTEEWVRWANAKDLPIAEVK